MPLDDPLEAVVIGHSYVESVAIAAKLVDGQAPAAHEPPVPYVEEHLVL